VPRILRTFRGLIKRAGLLEPEAQMIKGLSRKIREKTGSPHEKPDSFMRVSSLVSGEYNPGE
jgi:endonuclease III